MINTLVLFVKKYCGELTITSWRNKTGRWKWHIRITFSDWWDNKDLDVCEGSFAKAGAKMLKKINDWKKAKEVKEK